MIKRFFTHGHPLAVSAVIALVAMLGYQIVPAFVGGNFLGQTGGGGQCADYGTFHGYALLNGNTSTGIFSNSDTPDVLWFHQNTSPTADLGTISTAGIPGQSYSVPLSSMEYGNFYFTNDPAGKLYMTYTNPTTGGKVARLVNADGTLDTPIQMPMNGTHTFAIDAQGNAYYDVPITLNNLGPTSNWNHIRIDKMSPGGSTQTVFNGPVPGTPAIPEVNNSEYMKDVLIADSNGNVWVPLIFGSAASGLNPKLVLMKISSSGTQFYSTSIPVTSIGGGYRFGGIAIGPSGTVWISTTDFWNGSGGSQLYKFDPSSSQFSQYNYPSYSGITNMVAGPDGNMWATFGANNGTSLYVHLIKITQAGVVTDYGTPPNSTIHNIAVGSDGNLWLSIPAYSSPGSTRTESVYKFSLCGTSQTPVGNTDGLLAHWTFDQGTINGSTVQDVSGNNKHGTIGGGAQAVNGCMQFDGVDDKITIPNFDRQVFTATLWMKQEGGAPPGDSVVGRSLINSVQEGGWGFGLYPPSAPNSILFGQAQRTGTVGGSTQLTTDVFHHIAIAFDGSTANIYVDGRLDGSGPLAMVFSSGGNYILGFRDFIPRSNFDSRFKGTMDDVRIYDRVLTAQEVSQLAQVQPSCNTGNSSSAQVILQCNNGAGTCNAIQSSGSCTTRQVTCPSGTVEAPGASAMACTNDGCTGSCVFCQPVQGSSSSRQVTSGGVCPPCRQACGMSGPVCLTCGAGTVPSCPAGSIGAPYCDLNNQPRCMFTQGGVTSATCGTANQASPLGCAQCMSAYCPGGDICTTGSSSSRAASSSSFRPGPGCGDGTKDAGEQCDDGNTVSGDGCSSQCKIEPGFRCIP